MNTLVEEYLRFKAFDPAVILEKKIQFKNHRFYVVIHHDMFTAYYNDIIISRMPIKGLTNELNDDLEQKLLEVLSN